MDENEKTDQTPEKIEKEEGANTSNTTENQSVTEEIKDFQPNYNIRNAKITDVKFINSFATNGKKVSEALSEVVKLAQRPDQVKDELADGECIITITPELEDYATDQDETPNDTISRLLAELKTEKENSAKLRLDAESNKAPELKPGEMFIVFDAKTGENIRKVRPFIAKRGYLQYEQNNHQDFINKLVNHAVNKVLRIDFDNIINPL